MELFKLFSRDLGQGNVYVPVRKEWINALLAVGQLGMGVLGMVDSANKSRNANNMAREKAAKDSAYYTRKYNEDYADTAAGQRLVNMAKTNYNKNVKRAEAMQAVSGGTAAATQMAKDSANNAMAQVYADIAANDTARKDSIDQQRHESEQKNAQDAINMERYRASQINAASNQALNSAVSNIGTALDQHFTSKSNLKGSQNNSTMTNGEYDAKMSQLEEKWRENEDYDAYNQMMRLKENYG